MQITPDAGSFRDPANRVFVFNGATQADDNTYTVYRGVRQDALESFRALRDTPFFQSFLDEGKVVKTEECVDGDPYKAILALGWDGVLAHKRIPFITYPYEWSFSMLKAAALLHLELIETALEVGWTLKDATPYNIQWVNGRPTFIDIPSFEPREPGSPWVGYRQFCSMFLIPLMLRAHLGIDHIPLLRSCLDGISPTQAAPYFAGMNRFKKGVFSHIFLPARVENAIAKKERDGAEAKRRPASKHSDAMVIGLVQSLTRLVRKLDSEIEHTDWSHYDRTHSYQDDELEAKKGFVEAKVKESHRNSVWDIGCNTGGFSKLVSPYADFILSLDGDHDAIEQLYHREQTAPSSNIMPMVMNLANISPNQGWGGKERLALDNRVKPDFVLCLALIHHMRISANIPNRQFLQWLRSLDASVIIEFVGRDDEMVIKLLTNKKEEYPDYNAQQFESECEDLFDIHDRLKLKSGKRELFYLTPKPSLE